jgi:hypothetical protein
VPQHFSRAERGLLVTILPLPKSSISNEREVKIILRGRKSKEFVASSSALLEIERLSKERFSFRK